MPRGNFKTGGVFKHQRGAVKDMGQPKLILRKNDKNNGTNTVYIKVGIPVSDFLYERYPNLKLAGAVERFLQEAVESASENSTV